MKNVQNSVVSSSKIDTLLFADDDDDDNILKTNKAKQ